jgi:hypothetical protein
VAVSDNIAVIGGGRLAFLVRAELWQMLQPVVRSGLLFVPASLLGRRERNGLAPSAESAQAKSFVARPVIVAEETAILLKSDAEAFDLDELNIFECVDEVRQTLPLAHRFGSAKTRLRPSVVAERQRLNETTER